MNSMIFKFFLERLNLSGSALTASGLFNRVDRYQIYQGIYALKQMRKLKGTFIGVIDVPDQTVFKCKAPVPVVIKLFHGIDR